MKELIAVGLWPLLAAGSLFGQTPSQVNFTFDGGPSMTSNTGCADVLAQDGTTLTVNGTAPAKSPDPANQVILTGYTQTYSITGYYICFMWSSYQNVPGLSLYLPSYDPNAPWIFLTEEGGEPLTYGTKTWGTRPDGTTMDGTQDGDTFTWTASSSFSDGSTVSLALNYIFQNTRFRHCRGGRGFTCWSTTSEAPYFTGGSGTYFFPETTRAKEPAPNTGCFYQSLEQRGCALLQNEYSDDVWSY